MKRAVLIFFMIVSNVIWAASPDPKGNLKGTALDIETKTPLIGVTILLKNTVHGATTDMDGNYQISNLDVGTYTVEFSYIGYESVTKTDVIIRSGKATFLNIEMKASTIEMGDVVITGGYFSEMDSKPLSAVNFSAEEIRRSPGTAGDMSRILFSLPSIAKVNDQRNSLIVRGGSPVENSFYLDNIEIPNINHFPVEGSSDGPIGILNVDFINDVNFMSGGFSPIYGERLSSVMELTYRDGAKDNFLPQLNLSMAGVGGSLEGPIGSNGSYMFSINRSYVDLIVEQIEEGTPIPHYGDAQAKVSYSIDDKNRLTFLDILSIDDIMMEREKAMENDANMYGTTNGKTNTAGINWQHIWGKSGYSNTSFAHTYTLYDRDYRNTFDDKHVFSNHSSENLYKLRNVNYLKLNSANSIEFGFDASGSFNKFDMRFGEFEDRFGNILPELKVADNLDAYKAGVFIVHNFQFLEKFKLTYGLRSDYFSYNENVSISPRASLSYSFDPMTTFTLSAGIFNQETPANILAQNELFKELKTPQAIHYIFGINRLLGETTRLSLEFYFKDYKNLALDPEQPTYLLFDQSQVEGIFFSHESLSDKGKATSKGIEIILQKKLAEDFYGMVSASVSKSKYMDYNGAWHDRIYDNEFNFNIEGGYIPGNDWEFKVRWIYAGGAPYTPFDLEKSIELNKGIWNLSKTNSERLPDYHSLNVRIDKRFYFESSNLIVYLSVWNAYGRKNIAEYFWNEVKHAQDEITQWGVLPVLGIEYEF